MQKLETANGKEVKVVPTGRGAYKIQFTTGGELPEALSGEYTSSSTAYIAAVTYVEKTKEKVKKTKED
jgi:hypothetical protein